MWPHTCSRRIEQIKRGAFGFPPSFWSRVSPQVRARACLWRCSVAIKVEMFFVCAGAELRLLTGVICRAGKVVCRAAAGRGCRGAHDDRASAGAPLAGARRRRRPCPRGAVAYHINTVFLENLYSSIGWLSQLFLCLRLCVAQRVQYMWHPRYWNATLGTERIRGGQRRRASTVIEACTAGGKSRTERK